MKFWHFPFFFLPYFFLLICFLLIIFIFFYFLSFNYFYLYSENFFSFNNFYLFFFLFSPFSLLLFLLTFYFDLFCNFHFIWLYNLFVLWKFTNSDLIWRKKKSLAPQRHRPECLARNEAFPVRFFSLYSIARATFLRATCRKGNKRGTITRRR